MFEWIKSVSRKVWGFHYDDRVNVVGDLDIDAVLAFLRLYHEDAEDVGDG